MIRLLLDQNAPYAATALLVRSGVDAVHARDLGLARATDATILAVAAESDRIVVTHDADFAQLLALQGHERPSVVHLRREFETNADFVACVLGTLTAVASDLEAGSIASVDDATVRVRRLPVLGQRPTGG